jgi:quercetin dioxygenase-like cupin family protein
MTPDYLLFPDLSQEIRPPEKGLTKHTLYTDDRLRMVLFAFAAGHELVEHEAPGPVTLYFVEGEASITVGPERKEAHAGTLVHMQPKLRHSVTANTPVLMLLYLLKP